MKNTKVDYDILNFIENFSLFGQEVVNCFTRGNCYWFAMILYERFSYDKENVKIVYEEIDNHFACEIDGAVYDITGQLFVGNWVEWKEYILYEPSNSYRIIRDCILK